MPENPSVPFQSPMPVGSRRGGIPGHAGVRRGHTTALFTHEIQSFLHNVTAGLGQGA